MEDDGPRSIQFEEQLKECLEHGGVEGEKSNLGTKSLRLQCVWKLRLKIERLSRSSQVQGHSEEEGDPKC